jgi:hypothetical protein
MDWRNGKPTNDFVGFAIEYAEPGATVFWPIANRLAFVNAAGLPKAQLSTRLCPIQKFRWLHTPYNADMDGLFTYRVTPVFMDPSGVLSYGEPQTAQLGLARETYPGQLDVAFTRGFISSQAFVDHFAKTTADVEKLVPPNSTPGADMIVFKSPMPNAQQAYDWMGFEARKAILDLLDAAIADPQAKVCMVAYDLNESEVVSRMQALGPKLRLIVDDEPKDHGQADSAETLTAGLVETSAGAGTVIRQHMGAIQHNKFIVVDSPTLKKAICGSTNFSYRGFLVQNNNAITVTGDSAIAPFQKAFEAYWAASDPATAVKSFEDAGCGDWQPLGLADVDAQVTFSPHSSQTAKLAGIAADIATADSSLLFSLAFLYQTPGAIKNAITQLIRGPKVYVVGISDRAVGGLDVVQPGSVSPATVEPAALKQNVPPPFSQEPDADTGIHMHHKFVVIDFNTENARVYMGSYNFSNAADTSNGENLMLIKGQRVATAYAIQAMALFDHYQFRDRATKAGTANQPMLLQKPPAQPGQTAWFDEDYTDPAKIRDRQLFAS